MTDRKEELKQIIENAKAECNRIVQEEEAELQRQEELEAIRAENRKRQAELEVKEKQRKAEMEEAVRSGKLTLGDPHLGERERHEVRQILRIMQEEQEAAYRKETEKSPFEKLLEKHEQTRRMIDVVQLGTPYAIQQTLQAVKLLCEVTGELLAVVKPEDGEEAGQ